jgi:NSS family neurotransmitter:Na+ symporter
MASVSREQWSGRMGFVLAATGSAVGLGSIWKFPYIAGMNGGGLFILIYIACVALIALPVLIAEIMLGRHTRQATVAAVRCVAGKRSAWVIVGWIGVLGSALILSYYSVVGGWTLHYLVLSGLGGGEGMTVEAAQARYRGMLASPWITLGSHSAFMIVTTLIVAGGISGGLERANRALMPALLLLMGALLIHGVGLPGFKAALGFTFTPRAEAFTASGVLVALGHSFFSLSVGLGAMLTYGSYLSQREDLPLSAFAIAVLDTLISVLACLVVFPILFSHGLRPDAGPGLIFLSLPIAFGQMPGGSIWALLFFGLLAIAALASAISMLEVVTAHLIEERNWSRRRAACVAGLGITLLGIPAAWSESVWLFSEGFAQGMRHLGLPPLDWFRAVDGFASTVLLPLGGLGLSALAAWMLRESERRHAYQSGSAFGKTYTLWRQALRWVALPAIILIAIQGWVTG